MTESLATRRGFLVAGAFATFAAFLPFVRTFFAGNGFYFRDLSGQFLPVRRFVLDGLAKGEWRFWNPFVHEGEPLVLSPFGYLPDFLQLFSPNEFGISLTLALHIPFAAAAFILLARELKLTPTAAAAGGVIYALGGFALSTINLYFYVQTLAWAPLFILSFRRALASEGGRRIAISAVALGMMLSTAGVEIILQAGFLALLLTPPVTIRQWARAVGIGLLGASVAAMVIAPMIGLSGASERSTGFPTAVVLSNSISPLSFMQVLIAGFFGDPSNLTGSGHWWGVKFFPNGFPYFNSLYLGSTALALAMIGATSSHPLRRRLAAAAAVATFVCLGVFVGWSAFFDLSPALRFLRFPVKAFYTVHFSVALLAAFGVHAIGTAEVPRKAIGMGALLGVATASIGFVPFVAPAWTEWFMDRFLDSRTSPAHRVFATAFMAQDAFEGGMIAILAAGLCLAARLGSIERSRAAWALSGLVAADLLRAGAGLNPSVAPSAYDLSPEVARFAEGMREEGRRYFTCNVEASNRYWQARQLNDARHEGWILGVVQDTLTPATNSPRGVRSALSRDNTGTVGQSRALPIELLSCLRLDALVPRLRAAGVSRLVAIDPMEHPDLRLIEELAPARLAPLHLFLYEVSDALPRFSAPVEITRDVPGHISFFMTAATPVRLDLLEPVARGWRATLNGVELAIQDSGDGHQRLFLPAGRNEVRLDYRLPGLVPGLILSVLSAIVCLALFIFSRPAPTRSMDVLTNRPPGSESLS